MRLIDADGLLEKINILEHLSGEYADSFVNAAGNRSIELGRLEDYIENVPTVDAKPVVHAHWIDAPNYWKCSNCGETYWSMNHEFIYCPNCGAKMGGEQDE